MVDLIWYPIRSDAVLFPHHFKSPICAVCAIYPEASEVCLPRNEPLPLWVRVSTTARHKLRRYGSPLPNDHSSIPLPRRLRTGASAHALLIVSSRPQPLLRPQLQLPLQFRTRLLPMYEIAEAASHTALSAVEPAACFSKIGHGRQFAVDGAGSVPAAVERVAGGLGRVFVLEARVDVAD